MNLLKAFEGLLFTRVSIFKSVCKLANLEIQLARLSIYPLIIWICLLIPVLSTLWLTILLGAGYGLQLLFKDLWITVSVLCLTQLGLILIIVGSIKKHLNRMKLSHTRDYLNSHSLKVHNEFSKKSS